MKFVDFQIKKSLIGGACNPVNLTFSEGINYLSTSETLAWRCLLFRFRSVAGGSFMVGNLKIDPSSNLGDFFMVRIEIPNFFVGYAIFLTREHLSTKCPAEDVHNELQRALVSCSTKGNLALLSALFDGCLHAGVQYFVSVMGAGMSSSVASSIIECASKKPGIFIFGYHTPSFNKTSLFGRISNLFCSKDVSFLFAFCVLFVFLSFLALSYGISSLINNCLFCGLFCFLLFLTDDVLLCFGLHSLFRIPISLASKQDIRNLLSVSFFFSLLCGFAMIYLFLGSARSFLFLFSGKFGAAAILYSFFVFCAPFIAFRLALEEHHASLK